MEKKKKLIAVNNSLQYDAISKELLSNKDILAYILAKAVDEFKGMNPKDIVSYIETDPEVANTNKVVFGVRMKDGLSQVTLNIEIIKDKSSESNIFSRAIFDALSMISSQKEEDLINTNFNGLKRVFSIWLCMNMSGNIMNYVHFENNKLLGSGPQEKKIDLLNIVLIGISNELPEHDEKYELHRLLGALFSNQLSVEERLNIIEGEYNIPVDNNIRFKEK